MARSPSLRVILLLLLISASMLLAQTRPFRPFSPVELTKLLARANDGYVESQFKLGIAYHYGAGVAQDLAKAEYWLKKAAGSGDTQAQVQLGLFYLQPEFLASRPGEAKAWFMRAAAAGSPYAEYNLGLMYQSGLGIRANKAEAERWFQKSARHGLKEAKTLLAMLLLQSDSAEKQKEGFDRVFSIARQGNPEAENAVGVCYQTGRGTVRDVAKAMEWFRQAAQSGNATGMHNLGRLYYLGVHGSRDLAEAGRWYSKACEAGEAYSCGVVANMIAHAEISPQDFLLAYAYATIGKRDFLLEPLAAGLTAEERERALTMANQWRMDHPIRALGGYRWQVPMHQQTNSADF